MKKLKFWLMAMLAIVATASLTACGDDDKDEPNEPDAVNSPIVGTWFYENPDKSYYEEITFSANGTYKYDSYDTEFDEEAHEEGTYTINGNKATLKCTKLTGDYNCISEYVGETTTIKWSVSGDKLTLTIGGGSPDTYSRKK